MTPSYPPNINGVVSVQMDGVLCCIHAVCFCIKYLSGAVELGHTALLVDKEGMENVKIVQRRPSGQHQSVLPDIQNQRSS